MSFPASRAAVCRMVLAASWLATAVPVARAADNYVDCQTGDDSGAGTAADPWKTIQIAVDRSNAGDRVRIVAGACVAADQSFPVQVKPGVSIVGDGSDLTVIDNTGLGSGSAAFYLADPTQDFPASQRLTDMRIDTETEGISLLNGSPTIANNVIAGGGTTGILISTQYTGRISNPMIEDNVFMDLDEGVNISVLSADASPSIRRNWFLGDVNLGFQPEVAVSAFLAGTSYSMAPTLENNVVTSSRIGFSFLGGSPTINNNTISATETALVFYSGSYEHHRVQRLRRQRVR